MKHNPQRCSLRVQLVLKEFSIELILFVVCTGLRRAEQRQRWRCCGQFALDSVLMIHSLFILLIFILIHDLLTRDSRRMMSTTVKKWDIGIIRLKIKWRQWEL